MKKKKKLLLGLIAAFAAADGYLAMKNKAKKKDVAVGDMILASLRGETLPDAEPAGKRAPAPDAPVRVTPEETGEEKTADEEVTEGAKEPEAAKEPDRAEAPAVKEAPAAAEAPTAEEPPAAEAKPAAAEKKAADEENQGASIPIEWNE